MSESKAKKWYIITGILFAVCLIRAVYIVIHALNNGASFLLATYIPPIIWLLMVSAYCFVFRQKKGTGTVLYCISVAAYFFSNSTEAILRFIQVFDIDWQLIITILVCVALLIVKFRRENVLILLCAALMIIYTVYTLYSILFNVINNITLLWCISDIALIFLWWLEGGHRIVDIIKGKKQTKQQFATLETHLRSLKEQFEAGHITQEEYDEKRKELLAQL